MECVEIWTGVVQNICVAAASIAGICFGWAGLRTWREQLLGTRAYELARVVLLEALHVRDRIERARNLVITGSEEWAALKAGGLTDDEARALRNAQGARSKAMSSVFVARWNDVADSMRRLRVSFLEVEVLWGKDAASALKPLDRCARTLRSNIFTYLDALDRADRKDSASDRVPRAERALWDVSEEDELDEFATKVHAAIAVIEDLARPHLRLCGAATKRIEGGK